MKFCYLILSLFFISQSSFASFSSCTTFDDFYSETGCTVTADKIYAYSGEVDVKIFQRGESRNVEKIAYIVGPYSLDGELTFDDYLDTALPKNMQDMIFASGADIAFLNYSRVNADYLQDKAYAFISAMKKINTLRGKVEPSVVMGISLGGVVARYALTTMEKSGEAHGVKYYISYDSPHNGAHIPLGLQWVPHFLERATHAAKSDNSGTLFNNFLDALEWFLDDFSGLWSDDDSPSDLIEQGVLEAIAARNYARTIISEKFDNPSAKQLLIQNRLSGNWMHQLGLDLQNELNDLGLPDLTKKNITVVNGSIAGRVPSFQQKAYYFTYDSGYDRDEQRMKINSYILGGAATEFQSNRYTGNYFFGELIYLDASDKFFGDGTDNHKDNKKDEFFIAPDVLPCSTLKLPVLIAEILEPELAKLWPNPKQPISLSTEDSCFIPTYSALGAQATKFSENGVINTPFDVVIADSENSSHVPNTLQDYQRLEEQVSYYFYDTYVPIAAWLIPILHILH